MKGDNATAVTMRPISPTQWPFDSPLLNTRVPVEVSAPPAV
jgi:hypothetical protein